MSKTLYEQVGYKALKLFSLDQIVRWLVFLQHNQQVKEGKGLMEEATVLNKLIEDFRKAEQELLQEKMDCCSLQSIVTDSSH